MTKILITGSLGYIGGVLAPYLQEHNFECTGLDTGFFEDCTLYAPAPSKTIIKDIRDFREEDLKGIDVVIHLAGMMNETVGNLSSERIYDPIRKYTLDIAQLCKKLDVRFIFSSSCSVYGIGENGFLNEESPVNPQTPYATNKYQIEQDLNQISDRNFSPIALRLSTVFGLSPYMRFDMLVNMLVGMAFTSNQIILNSDGESWRPHINILDVCQAFRRCINLDYQAGQLLILNTGDVQNNHQTIEIARMVQEQWPGTQLSFLSDRSDIVEGEKRLIQGSTAPQNIQSGRDTRTYSVSFSKIKDRLPEFQCHWSVKSGISDMFERLKGQGLSGSLFKSENFYRLNHMNELHKQGKLDDSLHWVQVDRPATFGSR